tara:strand:- start:12511 stop:14358 length:1848 start_codon:yes stop_codon:yes gene_type:complete
MLNRLVISLALFLADTFIFSSIIIISYLIFPELLFTFFEAYIIFIILYLVTGVLLGLYTLVVRDSWPQIISYTSISLIMSFFGMLILYSIIFDLDFAARSVFYFIVISSAALLLTLISRVILNWFGSKLFDRSQRSPNKQRVLIIGAEEQASLLARGLQSSMNYFVEAFVTDNQSIVGGYKYSRPIISLSMLVASLKLKDVDIVWFTSEHHPSSDLASQVKKIFPPSTKYKKFVLEESYSQNELESTTFDLDGFFNLDGRSGFLKSNSAYVNDRCVLVTGAAGSIGRALVEQLLKTNAKHLVLLDISELGLYELKDSLIYEQNNYSSSSIPNLDFVLGNIQDTDFLKNIFRKYNINVVIHAAAYKHVPIVEENLLSAFKNNVLGTYNLVKKAIEFNVSNFILVSSDKAVRPTNFMGATKRIAELIVTSTYKPVKEFKKKNEIDFCAVRFGNVVGSSGSVMPKFISQIQNGGPVTVTDKRVERYFMSISEAASLVISAGQLSKGNKIFLLDMGKPIKILDLARSLIIKMGEKIAEKSGDKGIEIKIIGLRPGEKLYEELLINETAQKTSHGCIFSSEEPLMSWKDIDSSLSQMTSLKEKELLEAVKSLVPEFSHKP